MFLRWLACFAASTWFALPAGGAPLMRDFVGINGHTVQFRPELYRPLCGVVRDYHPVEWDLGSKTAELPPFPFAKNRVDWSNVYGSWRARGWTIDACLMFETVRRTNWANLETDARAYGEAFAREFGPSGKRNLIQAVEIGNEPGKWSDADYARVFRAMAEGLRSGDPKLKIATCNLTTGRSGDYEKSVDCITNLAEWVDVLTVHTYPQLEGWPTWRRSYPEDAKLRRYLQDVEALCRWRDAQAPGKPVWITEFGYDSSTKPAPPGGDAAKWVGVTDTQQAQWLVRSLLVFSAMPVDRAFVYFFNDEDQPGVHASSGVTRHFQPKPAFHALAQFQRLLGDCRFVSVVRQKEEAIRVQEYRNNQQKVVWVVWCPTGDGKHIQVKLGGLPGRVSGAERMTLKPGPPVREDFKGAEKDGTLELEVEEGALYLVMDERAV